MLNAVIIDDEPIGIETLRVLIEKYTPAIGIVATASSAPEGITIIEKYKPEVVFLDISMPGMNGFDLLERLHYKNFKLVFTTAHIEYAVKAIKNRAFDYLLKPISIDELTECVDRISRSSPEKTIMPAYLELAVKDGIIFVKPSEIIRLEAAGSYTVFFLDNGIKHIVSKNLKEYESQLDNSLFFRCHSSHLIHLGKVVKLLSKDGLFIQMCDGSLPQLSKKNKEEFLVKLKIIS